MAPPNSSAKGGTAADHRPAAFTAEELGFTPKPMVGWFDPWQLIRTGIKTLLSTLFGAYADKRELLSVLGSDPVYSHAGDAAAGEDFWIDYTADMGDGFDSTFTVASLVAKPGFSLARDGVTHELRRGRLLVFGGDQVYPTASRDEYQNRLAGPYQAALPWEEGTPPTLYAIPGNHDWYDGLASFLRLFCQERWFGGWKTRQSRSYFALELPHGWWLFGTDIQLESDVDHPQIRFFQKVLREQVKPDHLIILCTADPAWSHQWLGKDGAFATLGFFEEKVIRAGNGNLALVLSGDLHNYHRYQRQDAKLQRLTVGGGGAFLHATHFLPQGSATLDEGDLGTVGYEFKTAFPDHDQSKRLGFRALWSLFKFRPNPLPEKMLSNMMDTGTWIRSWGFAWTLAAYYLMMAWVLQSGGEKLGKPLVLRIIDVFRGESMFPAFQGVLLLIWNVLSTSPSVVLFPVMLTLILISFCTAKKTSKFLIGALHGMAHCALFLALFLGCVALNHTLGIPERFHPSPHIPGADQIMIVHPLFTLMLTVELFLLGFLCSGFLFGSYLVLFQNVHRQEIFSAQGIADWKNFLKLRIDPRGRLWLYPMGIESVCKEWKANPLGARGDPWAVPVEGDVVERVALLEKPLCYDPAAGRWTDGAA